MKEKIKSKTYTVDEVSMMSGFSKGTLYNSIKENKAPFKVIKLLDSIRIERTSCDEWLENGITKQA